MSFRISAFLRAVGYGSAVAMGTMPAPAVADPLPQLRQVATPEDAPIVAELAALMAQSNVDFPASLATLDGILPRLTRPTRLRGMVQFMRATALRRLRREREARSAVEESIRLLPGYSAPLILASQIENYSDRPGPAMEYLYRASRIDPHIVREITDYDLGGLLGRLQPNVDARQVRQFARRLFEIGWQGRSLSLRSDLARRLIEAEVEAGDMEAARAVVPQLADPAAVRRLLVDRRFELLWPALEEWAGPRQQRLWPLFLNELRDRWEASRDPEAGRSYLAALTEANWDQQGVDEFLPLFSERLDRDRDYYLIWVAAPLANLLARLGRWDEAEAMFTRAMLIWPPGLDSNALNLLANRGRIRSVRGDFAGGVVDMRAAIANGARRGGDVSANALRSMHLNLACSLHQLGRGAEAAESVARAVGGGATSAAAMYMCMGRHDLARNALIEGLAAESQRDEIILYLQPANGLPPRSAYGRMIADRHEALRRDPAIRAAVARYGRILDYPAGAGAPRPDAAPAPSAGATRR